MAIADTLTRIRFEKLTAAIGARVHGLALDQQATPDVVQTLREGLHEHGVLFFEFGKRVEDEEFTHFSQLFGEVEPVYGFSTKQEGDQPEAPCIDAKYQPLRQYRTNQWHSDGTPFERPPQAAILTPVEPPELGGGTMWSSMYAAYEDLSSHYQRLLDGLTVLHSTMRTPFVKEQTQTTHPAIIRDPVTGKKLLFVNSIYSERFLDMSERESDSLMRFLFEHVNTPEFHVSVTWRPGTVAVWEERATQHRADVQGRQAGGVNDPKPSRKEAKVAKRKLIITLHVNGPSKDTNPHVPYGPEEIAEQSIECWRQGAAVVHYHACDPVTGVPSSDVGLYAETVRLIKKECDIITFPTLGAHNAPSEGRVSHIVEMAKDLASKPDCIPVDILTTNLDAYDSEKKTFTSMERVYSNTTGTLIDISERVKAVGVTPVPMMWNVAGVRVTEKLVEMGVFKEPLFCEVSVFGEPYLGFGHPATVKGLDTIIDFFPPEADWRWTVSVIGGNAFAVLADAIERGGDVAIGLHDYAYPELDYPTNVELVTRVADLARAMGREVATAAEAREMLGMH